jgi:hypothetical protein
MLDRVASVLPEKERQLLAFIRSGYTIATASRMLKIPRGSRAYFGGRLVECARRELRAREASGLPLRLLSCSSALASDRAFTATGRRSGNDLAHLQQRCHRRGVGLLEPGTPARVTQVSRVKP